MKFAVFGDFKQRHSPVGPFFWGMTLIFGVNMHHTWDIKNRNSCEDPKTLPFLHFFNIDKLKNFLKRLGCENCMVFVTAFYPWNKGTQPLKRESNIGKRLGGSCAPCRWSLNFSGGLERPDMVLKGSAAKIAWCSSQHSTPVIRCISLWNQGPQPLKRESNIEKRLGG